METAEDLRTAELVGEALHAAHDALTEQRKAFETDRNAEALLEMAVRVVRLCNEAFASGLAM